MKIESIKVIKQYFIDKYDVDYDSCEWLDVLEFVRQFGDPRKQRTWAKAKDFDKKYQAAYINKWRD